jgi:hypothetical protein
MVRDHGHVYAFEQVATSGANTGLCETSDAFFQLVGEEVEHDGFGVGAPHRLAVDPIGPARECQKIVAACAFGQNHRVGVGLLAVIRSIPLGFDAG